MRKLLAYFRLSVTDAFEYRVDILLFVLGGLAQPLILLATWLAVLSSGGTPPLSRNSFIQYYFLLMFVSMWTNAWASPFIAQKIRLGNLSPYLLKPAHYFLSEIGENLGEKIVKNLFLLPILLFLFIFFGQSFPATSPFELLLFIIAVVFSGVIIFIVDVFMGTLAFYLDETSSVESFYDVLLFIFSGRLIPLVALPLFWQNVAFYLPFRYTLSFPLEILLRQISGPEIFVGFLFQIFWLGVVLFSYLKPGIKALGITAPWEHNYALLKIISHPFKKQSYPGDGISD